MALLEHDAGFDAVFGRGRGSDRPDDSVEVAYLLASSGQEVFCANPIDDGVEPSDECGQRYLRGERGFYPPVVDKNGWERLTASGEALYEPEAELECRSCGIFVSQSAEPA